MDYQINDKVILKDENDQEVLGTVVNLENWGNPGQLGIKAGYGNYTRFAEEVRLAKPWEIDQLEQQQ